MNTFPWTIPARRATSRRAGIPSSNPRHGLTSRKYLFPADGQLVTLNKPFVVLTPLVQFVPSVFG